MKTENSTETSGEELRKRYGDRYAYEWFVRFYDLMNLKIAKKYTDRRMKRITAFVAANTVITAILVIVVTVSEARRRVTE